MFSPYVVKSVPLFLQRCVCNGRGQCLNACKSRAGVPDFVLSLKSDALQLQTPGAQGSCIRVELRAAAAYRTTVMAPLTSERSCKRKGPRPEAGLARARDAPHSGGGVRSADPKQIMHTFRVTGLTRVINRVLGIQYLDSRRACTLFLLLRRLSSEETVSTRLTHNLGCNWTDEVPRRLL
jgi:hypothetical protein